MARCPGCRWWLRFAPYFVVYPGSRVDLWEGYCWNPSCDRGRRSVGGFRVISPSETVA